MEASAFPAPSGLARTRISIGTPLLRLRSDEQLVSMFRDGNNEAFRVIYDRYRQRLFAYTRQMLSGSRQDAEDALQDVFMRAYGGLRANDRELALRAWLYRVAHNRCVDELRRPAPPAPEVMELVRPPLIDPIFEAEQRESLRRLIADVRRLPDQQRSALLMRELGGMSYNEVADALCVSIPAVKSLLVRARVGLAQAAEARDTACTEIREALMVAHDRGVRPTGMARRHMRDCAGCRQFRGALRGTSRQFAGLVPATGPIAAIAKLVGFGGGASGSAAAGSGGGAAAASIGTSGAASAGALAIGAGHIATILATAVVTAGGAVEIQHTLASSAHRYVHHATAVRPVVISAPRSPAPGPTRPVVAPRAAEPPTVAPPSSSPAAPDPPTAPATRAPRGSDRNSSVLPLTGAESTSGGASGPAGGAVAGTVPGTASGPSSTSSGGASSSGPSSPSTPDPSTPTGGGSDGGQSTSSTSSSSTTTVRGYISGPASSSSSVATSTS